MKPYGRDTNLKGGKPWKIDVHLRKGFVNWWEDIKQPLTRSAIKRNWKREVKEIIMEKKIHKHKTITPKQ